MERAKVKHCPEKELKVDKQQQSLVSLQERDKGGGRKRKESQLEDRRE